MFEDDNTLREFKTLLEMPDAERVEHLCGLQLRWYQRIQIKLISWWWDRMYRANPHLQAYCLWESMYKGRF